MGLLFSRVWAALFGSKQEVRILILGLDNAGKTTILNKLHSPDKIIRTMPTIGFNVETLVYRNIKFQMWDLGGQSNIRPYWRCYYAGTNCVIFVVDSADHERLAIARKELVQMLEEEELREAIFLVMANKQDMANALTAAEISDALGLPAIKERRWQICKTVATTGEGLQEGLDWLAQILTEK
eukprot:TRINITY_DN5559_c0_g1_i2.p1 TRINITY_DN5559_c0_g1~~TRINITY_DN5559_c0_g1_i2.p1  ORF type:complete len:183 (+),score=28.17 TRINITY_DN5559_c0_g1_i2:49-597(+)